LKKKLVLTFSTTTTLKSLSLLQMLTDKMLEGKPKAEQANKLKTKMNKSKHNM